MTAGPQILPQFSFLSMLEILLQVRFTEDDVLVVTSMSYWEEEPQLSKHFHQIACRQTCRAFS